MGDGGRRRGGGIVAVGRSGGAEGGAGAQLGVVAVGRLKAEGLDDLGTKSGVSSILHECLSRNVMHVKVYYMFCLFVCLFIEGPLSVITILVLELLDSKGLCSVWFPVVNHGPNLMHLHNLERLLSGRLNLANHEQD